MRSRIILAAVVAALCVALAVLCPTAYADDGGEQLNENISDILDGLDLEALDQYLKEYGDEFAFSYGEDARSMIEYLIKGDLKADYSGYIAELLSVIFKNALSLVPAFAQIIALALLCAVLRSAEGSIMKGSVSSVVRVICYALMITILAAMLGGVAGYALECVDMIRLQAEIVTPILVTLTILAGGGSSGAVFQPAALFVSGGAVELVSHLVFPATTAVVMINFISKLSPDFNFSGTAALIKNILKWMIGITLAVFSLFITVQGAASSLFDGIFFKAAKYLVGSSVPIVGNFLSAGVDMVVAAGSVVKSAVGIVGIVLLVAQIAPPIVLFACFSLMLKFSAAVIQPLGESTAYSLLSDLASDIEYFIAGLATAAFMYALLVMLMISSAGYFV